MSRTHPSLSRFPVQIPPGFAPWTTGLARPWRDKSYMNPPYRPVFISGFTAPRAGGSTHHAVDFAAAFGAPVVATTNGRVVNRWYYGGSWYPGAGQSRKGGWYVRLEDTDGFIHYYSHLIRPPEVRSGQRVWVNQVLGFVGNTGTNGGPPHLHYQVRHPGGRGRGTRPYDPTGPLLDLLRAGGWRRFRSYSRRA